MATTNSRIVTIKFSYAGIYQYITLHFIDDKLQPTKLSVEYLNAEDVPDISKCTTTKEVLTVMKKTFDKVEVFLINGHPTFYTQEIQKRVDAKACEIEDLIATQFKIIFDEEILPILQQNKWFITRSWMGMPVLITKNDKNEWDNVPEITDAFKINYICNEVLASIDSKKTLSLTGETNPTYEGFSIFMNFIMHLVQKEQRYIKIQ